MKRIFIVGSLLLMMVFLVQLIHIRHHQFAFASYAAVDVIGERGNQESANRDTFEARLQALAQETNSTIARRVVVPNESGTTNFRYARYGAEALPHGLQDADLQVSQQSDLHASYLIISGALTPAQLAQTMNDLGYSAVVVPPIPWWKLLLSLFAAETVLIGVAICLLTFSALSLITRVKDLRAAGVRLLAGERTERIIFRAVVADVRLAVVALLVVWAIGCLYFVLRNIANGQLLWLLFCGLTLYVVLLLTVSLICSLVYAIGLRVQLLPELLKGRLPLKRLLVLVFINQFIAVLLVGWAVHRGLYFVTELTEQQRAETLWAANSQDVQLHYNAFAHGASEEESLRVSAKWYAFVSDAFAQQQLMLVENNLGRFQQQDTADDVHRTSYHPSGHTIYVTPNYLVRQGVVLDETLQYQLQHLQKGQYGLLLPEKLKPQTAELKELYAAYLEGFSHETLEQNSRSLFTTEVIVGYVADNSERFLYQTGRSGQEQFLTDPIIVVLSPTSTGDSPAALLYWSAVLGSSVLLSDYDTAVSLLHKHDIYEDVSYIKNSELNYLAHVAQMKNQLVSLILGAFLAAGTAMLLFGTTNLLYFEQFRKELFIKRISGMLFIETHGVYTAIQLALLACACTLFILLTRQAILALAIFAFFFLFGSALLWWQFVRETRASVMVLKGK